MREQLLYSRSVHVCALAQAQDAHAVACIVERREFELHADKGDVNLDALAAYYDA